MVGKSKELSSDVKNQLVKSYQLNKNISKLASIYGIPRTTVCSVLKKYKQTGSVENKPGRGRKALFTQRDNSKLSRVVKENRRRSQSDITTISNEGKDHSFYKNYWKKN